MPSLTLPPLLPKAGGAYSVFTPSSAPPGGGSGGGGGGNAKKALYVGVVAAGEGAAVEARRAFVRFKISDLPAAVVSARLEWFYVDKALPTANVSLIEIADFGTLDAGDWGVAERATITTSALTPATDPATKLSIDVTTRYNQAKTDGLSHFALKLQYATESEGVGLGRWYRLGATGDVAPTLVLTVTAGKDLRLELLATPVTVDLGRADALGTRAAVVMAGDGDVYPPLGAGVRLAATIRGLTDDVTGMYTGTTGQPITTGPGIMLFCWRSPDEGAGLTAAQVHGVAFLTARDRLADWFPLAGGLTDERDVREWVARIARACRSFAYLDQDGRETVYTEPTGGSGQTPVRLVRPWEHGPLRLFPLLSADGAQDPISRVEVFYAFDFLELAGWQGHALIASGETDPDDADRDAQAVDAATRYGVRESGGVPASVTPETGHEWVPLDRPGVSTGLRLRNLLWDRARTRPVPAQGVEVALPRFALGWRLLDEFELESYQFPSALPRIQATATAQLAATTEVLYQARRARCSVRALPRLTAEHGAEFPVLITAQIVAWDTP